MSGMAAITAVILAGGSSRRFAAAGQPIDKLTLARDGASVLEQVISAAQATSPRVIVVGPTREVEGVEWACENPPGGGPVSALAAALPLVKGELIALLAGDAPRGPGAIPSLVAAIGVSPGLDGAYLVTDRAQYLCSVYRTDSLRAAMTQLDSVEGQPLHTILDALELVEVADTDGWSRDIDTPDDARELGFA